METRFSGTSEALIAAQMRRAEAAEVERDRLRVVADENETRMQELEAALDFAKRPLAFNPSNGYESCPNCHRGWFPEDGGGMPHDPRCPHVVLPDASKGKGNGS